VCSPLPGWKAGVHSAPTMTKRLIITSDLHQLIGKWRDLVSVVRRDKPRFKEC
jgi:hypothetical protein